MTTKTLARFDPSLVRRVFGGQLFDRGAVLVVAPDRILARVTGSEVYRTSVFVRRDGIDGECSCPAFAREEVCKHMAAVVLAANAAAETTESPSSGALGALDRIQAYLEGQDARALVELLIGAAGRDPDLFDRLSLAATAHGADDARFLADMRRALDKAIGTGGFIDYRGAGDWAEGVDRVLDVLSEFASGPRAAAVQSLSEEAIDSLQEAIEDIDDSDGHVGGHLGRLEAIHLTACRTARPDPLALAKTVFELEIYGPYDTFSGSADTYADLLGEVGLTEFRRLARAAWDGFAPERRAGEYAVRAILDRFAEDDGDLETRITLRSADLSTAGAYLDRVRFLAAHGQEVRALRAAEDALWLFESKRPDERLITFTADLLTKAGRRADAAAHLWRAFAARPSVELFGRIRALVGPEAVARVIEIETARIGREPPSRWTHPADTLVRILMGEAMFEAAWAIVQSHGASAQTKEALARASDARHPAEALVVYAERVEQLVGSGQNGAYHDAAGLIARMARLRGAAEQTAYLAGVKARHGRKRNLMKLLP